MTICILGRQPELGLAELEALYGADAVTPLGNMCALVNADIAFDRLGGTVKTATLLSSVAANSKEPLRITAKQLEILLSDITATFPKGKIKLGLSVYGMQPSAHELTGIMLRLKKRLRTAGHSVRVVPNTLPALSSAQTYHNQLASSLGLEFVVVFAAGQLYIGRVSNVQNIDAYRIRDRERPKRDAFVGMLPPKLAQIIVNLAVGQVNGSTFYVLRSTNESQEITSQNLEPRAQNFTVLDPFCGTGVVLQEALLMGYDVYGTDLSPKMIDYTTANLAWLEKNEKVRTKEESGVRLEVADATDHIWRQPISVVACETYLGQPLGGQHPSEEKIRTVMHDTNKVLRDFLKNLVPQLASGTRLCIALPAWYVDDRQYHLPVIDDLASLGLEKITYKNAPTALIYRREDQVTAREIITLVTTTAPADRSDHADD